MWSTKRVWTVLEKISRPCQDSNRRPTSSQPSHRADYVVIRVLLSFLKPISTNNNVYVLVINRKLWTVVYVALGVVCCVLAGIYDLLTDDRVIVVCLFYSALSALFTMISTLSICFGGLEVACWPLVPKFAGSNPAEAVRFFKGKIKVLSTSGGMDVCLLWLLCVVR